MLVLPGTLTHGACKRGDPILGLTNLNHYSDPKKSEKTYHSGYLLSAISAVKGDRYLQQSDPLLAMEYDPNAFGGLGGYIFPENNRWMMYDADPTPFQLQRTLGIVFELAGSLSNDMIFGYSKHNAFNTSWRVQSNSNSGGYVNFGRDEVSGFPVIIPNASPGKYIMIVRQNSIDLHEFFINGHENPVTVNPRDDYYTSNRIRLMLGRIGTTRSEVAATIGPIFDCMEVISTQKIREIMKFWSKRAGIVLSH